MNRRVSRIADRKQQTKMAHGRKFQVEQLERRDLMTAAPNDARPVLSSIACGCSICTGGALSQLISGANLANASTPGGTSAAALAAKYALSTLPALSSTPGATATLVLDFNGNTLASWGSNTNVVTPVYDIDGDRTTFSDQELANIREIWARVAEDYAPFNINVTTVDPGNLNNGVVAKIAIGGSYSDWFGSSAGGVAYLGGFYNSASNVGFAFSNNLGSGYARYVAEAASHEAGHLFGLDHQAKWNGSTLIDDYNPGNANWAPIMGVGYDSAVTTWSNGATPNGPTAYQDDMAIIAGSSNGFGYKANTIGNASSARSLGTSGTVTVSGIIARNNDQQWYSFSTAGGSVSLNVATIAQGANLDSILEIRNSAGTVLYSSNPTNTLSSSLNATLGSGTYYAVVRSTGVYGRVGQYTLSGSFVPGGSGGTSSAPEISLLIGTTAIADGGSVGFGSTTVGSAITRTFTVRNDGSANLTLQLIAGSTMPAGYTLATNLGATTLAAGQTTTFSVRLNATAAGSFSGVVRLLSNDANEGTYDINIAGTVSATPVVATSATIIDNGGAGHSKSGSWVARTGAGRDGDYDIVAVNKPLTISRWQATNLAAGTYRISTTWVASATAATNARFWWGDEAASRGSSVLNQRVNPANFSSAGSTWQNVGTITLSAGRKMIWVYLSNSGANGDVIADAVRLERISASSPAGAATVDNSTTAAAAWQLADEAMAQWGRRR